VLGYVVSRNDPDPDGNDSDEKSESEEPDSQDTLIKGATELADGRGEGSTTVPLASNEVPAADRNWNDACGKHVESRRGRREGKVDFSDESHF
jgi:hypothetical protein